METGQTHVRSGKKIRLTTPTATTADVSALWKENGRLFSCRVRKEGPDYRTFVVESGGQWKCYYKTCTSAQCVRSRSALSSDAFNHCEHIRTTRQERESGMYGTGYQQQDQHLVLEPSALSSLAIQPATREKLLWLHEDSPYLIQRVSEETFVVRDNQKTQQHPLGLLHVRL